MKLKNKYWIGLMALTFSASMWAAEKMPSDASTSPQPDAAMKEAMKLEKPGDNHKTLAALAGNWNAVVNTWMNPTDKPQQTKGFSENKMTLKGRFLREKFKGNFANHPFEGLGITGYNNLKGEYQAIWVDSSATGMMTGNGSYDAATKTLNIGGTFSCSMTGEKDKWFRSERKVTNKDQNTYVMYFKDASGKEFKAMEIVYTRAK